MSIQIIGGKYRGRKISVPKSSGLRPTGNRIRETLFNWLQRDIQDLHTLDLFAGSGLLSFEAISRGAASSTLIEKNKKNHLCLNKCLAFFPNEQIYVYNADAISFLKKNSLDKYQLIFIDPPFSTNLLEETLEIIKTKIKSNILLYIEAPVLIDSLPFEAECLKSKHTGQVYYALFKTL